MSEGKLDPVMEKLLSRSVNFLDAASPGGPVVISSRIRLARNIKGLAFPPAAAAEIFQETASLVNLALQRSGALGPGSMHWRIDDLDELSREILFERRLVSRELLCGGSEQAVHVSADEKLSVMVNEEDHLRMQVVLPGYQLHKAWQMVSCLDDQLSCELDFAYDSDLGYLTACPSNVGTGMRISVMMHLPALSMAGHIKQLERGLAKLGLTMRGMFGENSENVGGCYQISNQSTLGESESDILERLARLIDQVIEHELNIRLKLLEQERSRLLDMIGRSFGVLRYSYILSAQEAFNSLSGVRLGVDMNMFNSLDMQVVNELFTAVSPGHLQHKAGRLLNENEQDAFRAQIVRERLKQNSVN